MKIKQINLNINPKSATTVVLVSGGYPEEYQKGKEILGFEAVDNALLAFKNWNGVKALKNIKNE